MTVYIGARTDAGRRDNNEDCVAVVRNSEGELNADAILIVADGMGGRASGEHASACAVETIQETLQSLLAVGEGVAPPYEDALATAMRRANAKVFELSRAKAGQKGMGTTCVAAVVGGGTLSVAHVGDSRAYLLRDGILRRVTEDHSYIQDQVRQGQLSDHDARNSRFKHVITKAIGIEATVKPDFHTHKLEEGDTVMLCSDGLSGVVDEAGMIQILSRTLNAQAASEYLVDAAKRQGSRDNISSIVLRFGGDPEPPLPNDLKPIAAPVPKAVRVRKAIVLPVSLLTGLVLGALLALALLSQAGIVAYNWQTHRFTHPVAIGANLKGAPKPAMVVPAAYAPPRVLLDKPVIGDVIAGSDAGVVVADADNGSLWSISSIGQVRPAGQISTTGPGRSHEPADHYLATDLSGRNYICSPADRMIRRFSPSGSFEMTIGEGLLKNPQALWVAANGDIYIIDDHQLKLISAKAS